MALALPKHGFTGMLRIFPHFPPSTLRPRRFLRGFTLLELMAVVIVIGVLAAIAIPSAAAALRERRSARAAHEVALLFNQARSRAIGRGSAVLVRYNYAQNGFEVREAILGAATLGMGDCAISPQSSCTLPATRWDATSDSNQLLSTFQPLNTSDYEMVDMQLTEYTDTSDTVQNAADFCISPAGRVFYRATNASGTAFGLMTGSAGFRVWMRAPNDDVIGVERTVFVFSNGTARVAL